MRTDGELAAEGDLEPGAVPLRAVSQYLDNGYSPVGWPVCPGLYAGRLDDLVKIGQSMNLPQRVDCFKFAELIGVRPIEVPGLATGEHPEDHAVRVKRILTARERAVHARLDHLRVRGKSRANANEWFENELVSVLFDEGWIVARARISPSLGTRLGRGHWPRS